MNGNLLPKRLSKNDLDLGIKSYFKIFPYEKINKDSVGADFGCGSGRWVPALAPFVKKIICIDPSEAIYVAEENHKNLFSNLEFERAEYLKTHQRRFFRFWLLPWGFTSYS